MHSQFANQMVPEQVLVTGANGFLGRNISRILANRGYKVVGLGHGNWKSEEWTIHGLTEWRQGDVCLDALKPFGSRLSAIIHCAGTGSVSFASQYPLESFLNTVVTTSHVLEFVRLFSPSTSVIYPSSASVYGTVETIPIREDAATRPISPYGAHKLMAENLVRSYAHSFGVSASIIRFFSIYGCGLRKQLLWDACAKFSRGETTFAGTGDEIRDWLHVEDAAELLLAAKLRASTNCPIVNGGTGVGATVRDVVLHLGKSLHKVPVLPKFSGEVRAGDPSRFVADITAAKGWGWSARHSYQKGVAEYAAWWHRLEGTPS